MTSLVLSSLSAFLLKGSSKTLTTKLMITAYSASCDSRTLACSFAQKWWCQACMYTLRILVI